MHCVSDTLRAMSGQGVGYTHLDRVRTNLFRVSTKVLSADNKGVARITPRIRITNTGWLCKKSGKFYVIRFGDLFQKSREISPLFLKY